MVGVLNHSNWITFFRPSTKENDSPQVASCINIKLFSLCFSLCKDVFNHSDISLISLFNDNSIFFLMNIYSDLAQLALKYLKNAEVIINNILIIMRDFNIHDNFWEPNHPYHSTHCDLLIGIADSMHLSLSFSLNHIPTRHSDNDHDSNLVINLMFLRYGSEELDNYSIHPEWRLIFDYTPFTIRIPIFEKHIQTKKHSLVKDSDEEKRFINEIINHICEINMSNISDIISLKISVQTIAYITESLWAQYLKTVNITKHSKS